MKVQRLMESMKASVLKLGPSVVFAIGIALSGCAKPAFLPSYDVAVESEITMSTIAARGAEPIPFRFHSVDDRAAIARTYRRLSDAELRECRVEAIGDRPVPLHARRESYYDLWSAVELLPDEKPNTALLLEFRLTSDAISTCYLAIGATDSATVFHNGRAIFGSIGPRENLYSHHLVPIEFSNGEAFVQIVVQKHNEWQAIPNEHLDSEWATNLQVFGSRAAAVERYRQRVAHPLDSPVLRELEDIRVDGLAGLKPKVAVFDLNGHKVASGNGQSDGLVVWTERQTLAYPFLGVTVVDEVLGEPVVLAGPDGFDAAFSHLKDLASRSEGPWAYRLLHLLKPEFEDQRNAYWTWWARKVTASACKLVKAPIFGRTLKDYPSMAVELAEFRSIVDATPQFYRYFRSEVPPNGERTLVVIIPTAPAIMRPYLELVADLQNTERTRGLASAHKFDVLWTGGVSPDYGGRVARHEVREALADYFSKFPPHANDRIFLVGACSAAVTALGLISDGLEVDGAVLWSPVVSRYRFRWARSQPLFPRDVYAEEAPSADINRLAGAPIHIYWDCDAEGHGDKAGSKELMEKGHRAGLRFDATWISPADNRFLWGPREAFSIAEWMRWIERVKGSKQPPVREDHRRAADRNAPATVKEALLRGFTISPNAAAGKYVASWRSAITAYRGSEPVFKIGHRDDTTYIDELSLSRELIMGKFDDTSLIPVLPNNAKITGGTTATLWGFKMASDGSTIEILTNLEVGQVPPDVDLLVDGSCRAAVWRLVGRRWLLIQVWI